MPKIELDQVEQTSRTGYPPPYDRDVAGRRYRRRGKAAGQTEIGISHVVLEPWAASAQRHWHDDEDEMVIMLSGKAVLVEDDGERELGPGDVAAWPKGVKNGHKLENRTSEPCTFIAISAGPRTTGGYSDIDMVWTADGRFCRRDGTEYPKRK
jgi:uncharacterized cupin superfamily protein